MQMGDAGLISKWKMLRCQKLVPRLGITALQKKLGRGTLSDAPGNRGLCLIHRIRPE